MSDILSNDTKTTDLSASNVESLSEEKVLKIKRPNLMFKQKKAHCSHTNIIGKLNVLT